MGAHGNIDLVPASVLLIEDEVDVRLILRGLLERSGRFDVVAEADDAATGIDLAVQHSPDVILLDLRLPDHDGRNVIPSLVTRSPVSMIAVLSGLEPEDAAPGSIAAGAFAFIEKSHIGRAFAPRLESLLAQFRLALAGEDIVAPASIRALRDPV